MVGVLSPEDIKKLTDRTRLDKQREELDFMAIPYRIRSNNTLLVLEEDLLQTKNHNIKESEPDFDVLNA